MGEGPPKQFRPLGRLPMYRWSLRALRAARARVVVVVPPWAVAGVAAACADMHGVAVAPGGARRQDSVANGLAAVPRDADVVLVHDAARPFVPLSLIGRVVDACEEAAVALPVLPIADTLKHSEDGAVVGRTVDRRTVFAAQTPQACRRDVLARILREAPGAFTDEADGAERLGLRPRMVRGSPFSFKVTTEDDFAIARAVASWLQRARRSHEDWMWV